ERILGAYVKLTNRKALEHLKAHRLRLATEVNKRHFRLKLLDQTTRGRNSDHRCWPREAEYRGRSLTIRNRRIDGRGASAPVHLLRPAQSRGPPAQKGAAIFKKWVSICGRLSQAVRRFWLPSFAHSLRLPSAS